VDPTAAVIVSGVLGLATGAGWMAWARRGDRSLPPLPQSEPDRPPAGVSDVLAVLRSGAIVLDAADAVVSSSPPAVANGLVRDHDLVHDELRHLARQVRRDGVIREVELDLPRGPLGRGRITVGARVAPLGSTYVLLLVDDRTEARRVEDVRRDFVVNVSHELKTPVGGLALLAEAVLEANDDPEAVARFAHRMQVESTRLTRLVQEIVDLSRLEIAGTLHAPELVDVGDATAEAIEQSRLLASSRGSEIVSSLAQEGRVFGDADLLVTAIRNLIGNAINYSAPGARVAVSVRSVDQLVEIAVADQGQGIPESEQARIFERFYRVDAARSRATGGTGLGLAIVKHICANHGGDVTVWSEPGHGSTFTMRLPEANLSRTRAVPAPGIPAGSPQALQTQPTQSTQPTQPTQPTQSPAGSQRTREVTS